MASGRFPPLATSAAPRRSCCQPASPDLQACVLLGHVEKKGGVTVETSEWILNPSNSQKVESVRNHALLGKSVFS